LSVITRYRQLLSTTNCEDRMKITLSYEFEDESEARAFMGETATRASSVTTTTRADEEIDAENPGVDAEGMAYNRDYHAFPPSKTANGNWRSARGKTAVADAARAAFKAAGGAVQPPADILADPAPAPVTVVADPAPAPAAPVDAPSAPAAAPAAPVARAELPVDLPPPVTPEQVFEMLTTALGRGNFDIAAFYQKHCGTTDNTAVSQRVLVDESVRRAMFDELSAV
jgi:hypothetical protein